MNIFLLLVISHILGDAVFTSSRLARIKRSGRLLYQLIAIGGHSAVHAFWAALLLFTITGPWIKGAFLVFVFHFIIDSIRSRMEMN